MATMPVEVVRIGEVPRASVSRAIALANASQSAFRFIELPSEDAGPFAMHAYHNASAKQVLDMMEDARGALRGYHPFIIALIDANLDGEKYNNLFGSHRAEKGLAVATIANVPNIIVPADRLHAYFLYYLARYGLSFLAPQHRNHNDSRSCVFDRKVQKTDLLKSMRARALCDTCRDQLLSNASSMSHRQFQAIEGIFATANEQYRAGSTSEKPRVFVGSSSEGLAIANKVQELLADDATVVVWNQGTVFGLGSATLEALEQAVLDYDFAVFVFTPDDELHTRGESKPVARDNVVFELGLFAGKLGRTRAVVLNPGSGAVALPSDLLGITTASYDAREKNVAASLGPPCNRIRNASELNASGASNNSMQRTALRAAADAERSAEREHSRLAHLRVSMVRRPQQTHADSVPAR